MDGSDHNLIYNIEYTNIVLYTTDVSHQHVHISYVLSTASYSPPPMTTHRGVGSDLHTATVADLHQVALGRLST